MKIINLICGALLVVGGLNWGLIGSFDVNLITEILGSNSTWTRIIYILIGVSAIFCLITCRLFHFCFGDNSNES